MQPHLVGRLWLVALLAQTGCFNVTSCIPIPQIPDAAGFGIPDASFVDTLEYDAIVGAPGPILDGGSTVYGALTFTTTFDGGARIETVTMGPGGPFFESLIFVNGDDSDVVGTADINLDGNIDYTYTSVFDGQTTYTNTTLTDTNFDGVFNSMDVATVDVSGGALPFQKTETVSWYLDVDGGLAAADAGSWVQQWTYTGAAQADELAVDGQQGSQQGSDDAADPESRLRHHQHDCDGQGGFPQDPVDAPGQVVVVPQTSIQILINGAPGTCNPQQTATLVTAFGKAYADLANCLGSANPLVGSLVKLAMSTRTLYVACSNTCNQVLASTDLPYSSSSQSWESNLRISAGDAQRMSINASLVLSGQSIAQVEEVLNHELLHFAGFDHNPPGSGSPSGHDMVYGCGRYCTQCQSGFMSAGWASPPGPQQWGFDCADCSDSNHVDDCGTVYQVQGGCSHAVCTGFSNTMQCDNTAQCCFYQAENCFGDGAADPGSRDVNAVQQIGDCINVSGAMSCASTAMCTPSAQAQPWTMRANCNSFPVGWCTSGAPQ